MENLQKGEKGTTETEPTSEIEVVPSTSLQLVLVPVVAPETCPEPSSSRAPVCKWKDDSVTVIDKEPEKVDKSPRALFGCKKCYALFPSCRDNEFRHHMLIEHDQEFAEGDNDIFEVSKLPAVVRRCRKCHFIVIDSADADKHRVECSPETNITELFEIFRNILTSKVDCGYCSDAFISRYQLKAHIEQKHIPYSRRILVDPEYRCTGCLKSFHDAVQVMNHSPTCIKDVKFETLLDLAKRSLFYCSVCSDFHATVDEKRVCMAKKTLIECCFCNAIFKDENNFVQHLKKYHWLETFPTTWNSGIISCPFCVKIGELATIQLHVLKVHYEPLIPTMGIEKALELAMRQKSSGIEVPIIVGAPQTLATATNADVQRPDITTTTAEELAVSIKPVPTTETVKLNIPYLHLPAVKRDDGDGPERKKIKGPRGLFLP